ncbi:MAG: polysaccharide deacetylase family protein [Bacteroidota bacterium]
MENLREDPAIPARRKKGTEKRGYGFSMEQTVNFSPWIFIGLVLLLLFANREMNAQEEKNYMIATWPGFRDCAVNYTFDDACPGQFSKALPLFDEYQFKLTLFVVSDWVKDWTEINTAAAGGHEVACHTASHPKLSALPFGEQKREMETSRDQINAMIPASRCVTMATPFCAGCDEQLASTYFMAVRGCQGYIEEQTPRNFMNVSSVICGDLGAVNSVGAFREKVLQAADKKGWLVYLLHGIDNDGGYSPLSSDTLRASLAFLKQNQDKYWVSTFADASRYIRERDCASLEEMTRNRSCISLMLKDTLANEEWYNYPLTIRYRLPAGWKKASIYCGSARLESKIVEEKGLRYIQFDAVPDREPLYLYRNEKRQRQACLEITG